MTSEADRLRAALSECGLFQSAEAELNPSDLQQSDAGVADNMLQNEQGAESNLQNATPTDSEMPAPGGDPAAILEALDRVFSQERGGSSLVNAIMKDVATHRSAPRSAETEAAPANATKNIHPRILQIREEAVRHGIRRVFFAENAGGFRAYAHLGPRNIEFGQVERAALPEMQLKNASECVQRNAESNITVLFEKCPARYGARYWMRISHPEGCVPMESLVTDEESRRILAHAADSELGSFICIVSPRGEGADDLLDLLACEWARLGRRVVSCGVLTDPGADDGTVYLANEAGTRQAFAQEGQAYFIPAILDAVSARRAIIVALGGWNVAATLPAKSVHAARRLLTIYGMQAEDLIAARTIFVETAVLRNLCENCKQKDARAQERVHHLRRDGIAVDEGAYFTSKGCSQCTDGFHGSTLIVNVVRADQHSGLERAHDALLTHGLSAAALGKTSVDEVQRVLGQ